VFSAPGTGCSLGVHPCRVHSQQPCLDFARTPLTCLAAHDPQAAHHLHLRVSIGCCLVSSTDQQ
jgi:hypothetical protein